MAFRVDGSYGEGNNKPYLQSTRKKMDERVTYNLIFNKDRINKGLKKEVDIAERTAIFSDKVLAAGDGNDDGVMTTGEAAGIKDGFYKSLIQNFMNKDKDGNAVDTSYPDMIKNAYKYFSEKSTVVNTKDITEVRDGIEVNITQTLDDDGNVTSSTEKYSKNGNDFLVQKRPDGSVLSVIEFDNEKDSDKGTCYDSSGKVLCSYTRANSQADAVYKDADGNIIDVDKYFQLANANEE